MPRKLTEWEREERAREKARKATIRFGVFVWAPTYREADAVRIFKRECDADRFARNADPRLNYVVRRI